MKICVATLVVLAFAYIYAEPCANNHECHDLHHITICHQHTHVVCSGGWCTCTNGPMGGVNCTQKSDCSSLHCPDNHDAHCVDSHCHCGMPANGGPGGPGGPGGHGGQP